MNIKYLARLTNLALVLAMLTACGGGGSSTTAANNSSSRVGTVTGFGSVFVNGVEYETDGANVVIDGQAATEADLEVGMVVTLEGSDDGSTGKATSISNDDELEGLVISNNVDATTQLGSMNIMGQTVNISATTVFESKLAAITQLSDIAVDSIVEVNGYSDNSGNIFATRLEVKAASLADYLLSHDSIEVKGTIASIDDVAKTFVLGGLTVNYATAIIDINGGLQSGQYVEVKSTAGLNTANELVASKIELENNGEMGHQGDENEEFEIKGIITEAFANNQFKIGGTTVVINANTELDTTTDRLLVGVMVEVEGVYDNNNNLIAKEVDLEDEMDAEVRGVIQNIDPTGTNAGTITLMDGTVIVVTASTMMIDKRDEGMTPVAMFNLTHLANSDYIKVHGLRDTTTGNIIAYKLERDDNQV